MAKPNLKPNTNTETETQVDETGAPDGGPLMVDLTNVPLPPETVEEAVAQAEAEVKKGAIDLSQYEQLSTKSAKIRKMAADGHKTADIARALGIRYQHARNVLADPLKRPQA
jgi:hypothetical protein